MTKIKWRIGVLLTVLSVVIPFTAMPALASPDYSFNLDLGNSALSGYNGPYANVSIHLTDATHATITATSLSKDGFTYFMGGNRAFDANVNSTDFSVSNITAKNSVSGISYSSEFTEGIGDFQVDGWGRFNLIISGANNSHQVDLISFVLFNESGSWSSAQSVLFGNDGGYLAASHVAAVSETGFATGNGTSVPIPGAAYLMGSGLIALLGLRRKCSS
jgi:hypothetical protein